MARIRAGLKLAIIYFVLTFRNRFFLLMYSRAYRLAVRAVVNRLSKIEGVQGIYISGSSAREEVFYGLSDIDFKVFVEGKKDVRKHDEIMALFNRLRRFYPMLGPADEKGIYFTSDFPGEWRRYPLVRHLFHEIHFKNRRIWGEDVIPDLPEPVGLDLILSYTWRVGDWQEKVFSLYLRGERLNQVQKRYLAYKGVADVCHLCLRLRDSHYAYRGRAAVIRDFLSLLDEPYRETACKLIREQERHFVRGCAGEEEVYGLFREVTGRFISLANEHSAAGDRIFDLPDFFPEIQAGQVKSLDACTEELRKAGIPVFEFFSLPDTYIPAGPLGIPGLSGRILLLLPERPLSSEEIRWLIEWRQADRHQESNRADERMPELLYVGEPSGMVYCTETDLTEYWIRTPLTDPFLFQWLGRLRGSEHGIPTVLLDHYADRARDNLRVVADLMETGRINRLDGATFQYLFARTLVYSLAVMNFDGKEQPEGGKGQLKPFSSPGFCLEREFPQLGGFAERCKGLDASGGMQSLRLMRMRKKAAMFLQVLLRLTGSSSEPAENTAETVAALSSVADEEKLSLSVVIITRDRASKLGRCLDSLAAQQRLPDEVVLVDNNSSDNTREVAESAGGLLAMRYVMEPEIGIPMARNRGIAEASGDIIAFLDDDAVASPEWLASMEAAFLQDPEIGIVGGAINHLDAGRTDLVEYYFSLLGEVTV